MAKHDYTAASVLLHEADPERRTRLYAGLSALGFKRIYVTEHVPAVWPALEASHYQLLLLSLEQGEGGIVDLASRLRRDDWPRDPFAPLLLTTSDADVKRIRTAAAAGPDQILLHPFTIAGLSQRVRRLLTARRNFVETHDYVGPCRRGPTRADLEAADTVPVPNAFRAVVENRPDLAPGPHSVRQARQTLRTVKLRNVARRIGADADRLQQRDEDGRADGVDRGRVEQLINSLEALAPLVAERDQRHLLVLWQALQQNLEQVMQLPAGKRSTALALVRQLAHALEGALELDADAAESLLALVPTLPELAQSNRE